MEHECNEGPETLEAFKALMTRAFQAPKSKTPFAKPKATKKAGTKAAPKKAGAETEVRKTTQDDFLAPSLSTLAGEVWPVLPVSSA